jgi:hypothetical protein
MRRNSDGMPAKKPGEAIIILTQLGGHGDGGFKPIPFDA